MYVDEVVLRDFRAIASSRVVLTNPLAADAAANEYPNVNVMVGGNGSGKSSVLKAIAATVTGSRRQEFRQLVDGWPRIGGEGDAEVTVRLSSGTFDRVSFYDASLRIGANATTIEVTPRVRRLFGGRVFAAYGPRRQPTRRTSPSSWQRPHLLFDDAPLASIPAWLPQSSYREQAASILNRLLPDDVRCSSTPDRAGNVFAQRGISLPVGALSDGIQSFLGWVGDLLARMSEVANGDLHEVSGVVLVDEIDQHLHASWQQSIIGRLAAEFPHLQFVCTAQSPMIVSALRIRNLHLIESDSDSVFGSTTVRQFRVEDVYGLSADQVLRSSYFGLESTRSEPVVAELRALANRAQIDTADPELSLTFMRRLAEITRQGGGTR
jgi:hypothetical protein